MSGEGSISMDRRSLICESPSAFLLICTPPQTPPTSSSTTRRVRSAVSPDGVKAREFYRIKYGPSESSALLMSDRTVQHFDLRVSAT